MRDVARVHICQYSLGNSHDYVSEQYVISFVVRVHNTWTSICAIARQQDNVTTFASCGNLEPYITKSNALTFIVFECAPVRFYVIFAYTVHRYRIICILAGTCNRYQLALSRSC